MAAAAIPMVVGVLGALQPILGDVYNFVKGEVEQELELSSGSSVSTIFKTAIARLRHKGQIDGKLAKRLELGVDMAHVCNNNAAVVKSADENPLVNSIADFAVQYDTAKITRTIAAAAAAVNASDNASASGGPATEDGPEGPNEGPETPKATNSAEDGPQRLHIKAASVNPRISPASKEARQIRAAVFTQAPTATVRGMLLGNKVKLGSQDQQVKEDLVRILGQMPADALVTQPMEALEAAAPDAMQAMAPETRHLVRRELKTLKRVATVASTTTAMQGLLDKGITSSSQILSVSEPQFARSVASVMPEEDAVQTYRTAAQIVHRNQSTLVTWLQLVQGSGLEAIDGAASATTRRLKLGQVLAAKSPATQASLEALFGSMDQCAGGDDCMTVYSPAAYLVDLLEFLRTTGTRDTLAPMSLAAAGHAPDLRDTVLERFLRRRPDIGHLQLTCENTNAILPYTDLANEVMESFLVNMTSFAADFGDPRTRQLRLDAFNVVDQDSRELLAEPQNTNADAYQILAQAVSPIDLPYHQPVDAQRAFLDLLGASRHDLLDAFRPKPRAHRDDSDLQKTLATLQNQVYNRQADAEALGLVQEEYLILTGQVFFAAEFFQQTENRALSAAEYGARIGLRPAHAYWGYKSTESLQSLDDDTRLGLCFVKRQLLPRSGLTYQELADLVETGFVNPDMPRGRTKRVFDTLRFSYRFLQTLVDHQATDARARYGRLAEFLVKTTNLARLSELLADDAATATATVGAAAAQRQRGRSSLCVEDDEVRRWVYEHFESIGQIITLDVGQGPRLTITGSVVARADAAGALASSRVDIGRLAEDGSIRNAQGVPVAHVNIASRVLYGSASDGATLNDKFRGYRIQVENGAQERLATVENGYLCVAGGSNDNNNNKNTAAARAEWVLPEGLGGGCNIDNVRLVHLDGSGLAMDEWTRLHKFIRLWRKIGWSIDEIDMALTWNRGPELAVQKPPGAEDCGCKPNGAAPELNGASELITLDHFSPDPKQETSTNHPDQSGTSQAGARFSPKVTVDTIHQLSVIKKIVALTGLEVEKLLTFWVTIPSRGAKSLYHRLFLTSNVSPHDKIFGPDENGDFFTRGPCKISDNLLVVLAAFGLRATDMDFFLGKTSIEADDKPTADNRNENSTLRAPVALVQDVLSMENLSLIYRHTLLSKMLQIPVPDLAQLRNRRGSLPNPFAGPDECLALLQSWQDLTGVGLLWPELRYVAVDIPTPHDPLAPNATTVLQTAKELFEGAQAIRAQHPRVDATTATVTEDVVRAKLALLFGDGDVVDRVLRLLAGVLVTVVDAPALAADLAMAKRVAAVSDRFTYVPAVRQEEGARLQVRGIPSPADEKKLLALLSRPKQDLGVKYNGLANGAVPAKAPAGDGIEDKKPDDAVVVVVDARLVEEWAASVTQLVKSAIETARGIVHDSLDRIVPWRVSQQHILAPDSDTSPNQKRLVLMQYLVVFLQNQLTRILVEETITSAVGFKERAMAGAIVNNISMKIYGAETADSEITSTIPDPDPKPEPETQNGATDQETQESTAMDFLLDYLHSDDVLDGESSEWTGYLTITSTDTYSFLVESEATPDPITLNDKPYAFVLQQENARRKIYVTKQPVKLESGKLYALDLVDLPPSKLQWKPASGSRVHVPNLALLPRRAQDELYKVFTGLQAAAIIINRFRLSVEEVLYIYNHREDFGDIEFIAMRAEQLKRLHTYVEFRDSLPANAGLKLIHLFGWAKHHDATKKTAAKRIASAARGKQPPAQANPRAELISKLVAATGWKEHQIAQIMSDAAFASTAVADYRNSLVLRQFARLIALSDRLQVEIPRLFSWAKPLGTSAVDFARLHAIAEDMKRVARARFGLASYAEAVRPASDRLRENQRRALVSYLLAQDEVRGLDILDADGLFEYFLIDPQMTPLVETSRIKQAIATVQVYVQRCLLGLEEAYGVPLGALDRQRWAWMQKYRTWEANRRVFLYPENWIEPTLRDDKSEFFAALESALAQKDLTQDAVAEALKTYLYSVSEVSNLVVAGLCVDHSSSSSSNLSAPIHVFARTQAAPYTFYYNVYRRPNWRGWTKMHMEIPHYGDDNFAMPDANAPETGAAGVYLAPLALNGRVVVFIPQITKKTAPSTSPEAGGSFESLGKGSTTQTRPWHGWEVKLSWTELRNNTWTPRQLCPDGPIDWAGETPTPVDRYLFVPVETQNDAAMPWREARIAVYRANDSLAPFGMWSFSCGRLSYERGFTGLFRLPPSGATSFGYLGGAGRLHSYQAVDLATPQLEAQFRTPLAAPYAMGPASPEWKQGAELTLQDGAAAQPLYDARLGQLMAVAMQPTATALDLLTQLGAVGDDSDRGGGDGNMGASVTQRLLAASFGRADDGSFNELATPCALYNWELGLHGPMLIINQLLEAQQFEQALAVCHCVFNPMAKSKSARGDRQDLSRFWVFAPFRHNTDSQTLENMFQALGFEENRDKVKSNIDDWRDNPFSPHAVARRRPRAYMIWMVTKYIRILIEFGDYYFRQNTLETVPNAIQMYILASHLFGPRGSNSKAKRPRPAKAHTYNSLVTKFDAFSNALVQMEETFPFSNQTPLPVGKLPESPEAHLSNMLGFAGGLLFAIPENPELRTLGDTIDDRLFKLRHSQDIQGLFRKLPLFEPPIDPHLLVQAQAQGLSLSSVLNDLGGGPMPNFRFQFLLGRALELASEVKAFGQALLAAQEKRDAEAYSQLRARHEVATQNMVAEIKALALDEAQRSLEALQYARQGPVSRMRYYLQLTGEELSAIPEAQTEFQQLSEKLQTPVEEGGLRLLPLEKQEMDLGQTAATLGATAGSIETLAGVLGALPDTGVFATPLGVGGTVQVGGRHISSAATAAARAISVGSGVLSSQAGMAGRKAVALRSLNDRLQQANAAGYEISHLDKQILAARVRVAMARRDIDTSQRQAVQAREAEDFLRSKYTNADLYAWVFGQTKTLFYSSYTQAYDMAKNVERTLRFERPQLTAPPFIQPGYWNAARDGLLAGEALYHGLKQLETAYMADRGYDYEVTRHVSLRQIDPLALLRLRDGGAADFAIPELLFDMDFPGHYLRRIKSVAVTIPCVVGPYAGVNCTLRLLSHRYRVSASLSPGGYAEVESGSGSESASDLRFSTTHVPISAIAVSSGQADAGVFEFSPASERFLPFEGSGAISKWRLELPTGVVRPFDYATITDVVLTLRYTACEGGAALRDAAQRAVADFARAAVQTGQDGGLSALVDVRSEYATEWAGLVRKRPDAPAAGALPSTMRLDRLRERLPLYVLASDKGEIVAQDISVVVEGEIKGRGNAAFSIMAADDATKVVQLSQAPRAASDAGGGLVKYVPSGKTELPVNSWSLQVNGDTTGLKRMWVVIKYRLP